MTENNRLKLQAVALEDVKILSALLQDGLVAASDLHYQKRGQLCDASTGSAGSRLMKNQKYNSIAVCVV